MPVEITSLGHVSVTGPGELDEDRRDLLTEIVVYLALHPEGIHPNVLSAAIWPRGVSDDVRDSTLAQAATWLGVDEQGEPRLAIDSDGRWRLSRSGVRLDWDAFRALANRAATGDDPIGDLELALTQVTGAAWTGLPAPRYGWLAYETVEADVRVAAVAVARRLAELTAQAGDPLRRTQRPDGRTAGGAGVRGDLARRAQAGQAVRRRGRRARGRRRHVRRDRSPRFAPRGRAGDRRTRRRAAPRLPQVRCLTVRPRP